MSTRRLALELDLDSGSFTAKMRQAGRETEVFERKVTAADASLRRIDRGVNGATAKLRDFVLVMGNMRSAIENARFFFVGLAEAAVNATAEIERTTFLLRGLSKESTEFGKRREAQQNLEGLIATAKKAPFSIQALSDTFVKFKAGGLDPTNGSMQSLVDAVAAFGGSDELLKRAAVAIQQMGGKGVVSMEELRQQLGEAVPTAINMMAKGLGKSYADLVKEISLGKVRAEPALKAMFEQFQIAFGGKAAAMMDTFQGRVSQLKTGLVELALAFTGMDTAGNVTDGSLYDSLKSAISGITKMVSSAEFKGGIADLGSLLGETATGLGMFANALGSVTDVLPSFLGVKEAVGLLTAAIVGNLAARAGKALAEFVGKGVKGSRDMIGVTLGYRQAVVENARIDVATTSQAVASSKARVSALTAEAAAQRQLIADGKARLAAANLAATTGRTPGGQFADRTAGELQATMTVTAMARAKQQLAAIELQLAAATNTLTAAQARATQAARAQAAALGLTTVTARANTTISAQLAAALAFMNRGLLAASAGARTLWASLTALTTAEGRAAAGAGALALTIRVTNGAMIAGSVAARGLSAALGFFGGALGIAIMAVAAAVMGVASSLKETKEQSEEARTSMQGTAAMLHRMAEEGIISSSAISDAGNSSETAAGQIDQVGASAMAAASNLRDYAVAARQAAIAEIDAKIAIAKAARGEAAANTASGSRANLNRAANARTGTDGQRTLTDFVGSIGADWNDLVRGMSNFANGGQTERMAQGTVDQRSREINALTQARAEVGQSGESAYADAFRARPPSGGAAGEAASSGGGGGSGRSGSRETPDTRGMSQAVSMLERVKGIEAEIAGAGKEAAKMMFALDNDPAMAGVSADIKENMMEAARAVDIANARMEGFRAFEGLTEERDKQVETTTRLQEEQALLLAGTSDLIVENARYRAGLSDNVRVAEQYTEAAKGMADEAARAQRINANTTEQNKAIVDINAALAASRSAANDAFEDFASGASESDRELNRYRRSMMLMVNLFPAASEGFISMKAAADAAFDNLKMEKAVEALMAMRQETDRMNADAGMSSIGRAQSALTTEADLMWQKVEVFRAGTVERIRAEDTYYQWKAGKEREIAMSNPIAQMAREWGDLWGNLQNRGAEAMGSLVDGLVEGKMSFKDFAASLLKDIAKIIIKAMIAKAILAAMGMMNPSGGSASGSMDSFGSAMSRSMSIPGNHGGGVVGKEATFMRTVPSSMFDGAPKMHGGGIAGLKPSEVPTILQKKEGVFTPEQMSQLAPAGGNGAMPNIQVNVINESGTPMDAQQGSAGGKFDGKNFILDVVIDAVSKPGKMREAMKGANMR